MKACHTLAIHVPDVATVASPSQDFSFNFRYLGTPEIDHSHSTSFVEMVNCLLTHTLINSKILLGEVEIKEE